MKERIRKWMGSDAFFVCGGILVALFWLWRLPLGMANADEAFYITVPMRLLKGDYLLTDEWHVTQLSGFLLTPFMALYRLIKGDMQGIVLTFRLFWLAAHMGVMCVGYLLMRRRGRILAAAASFIYGFFAPYSIMALSYNSMGVAAVYLLAILFFMGDCTPRADAAKGVLLAAAVLCNPYCLLIYACLLAGAVLQRFLCFDEQLEIRHIVFIHAGIMLLLIPFSIHVLVGMDSVRQLAASLEVILSDPEHPSRSFFAYTWECLRQAVTDRSNFFLQYTLLLALGYPIRRLRPYAIAAIALLCGYTVMWDARWLTYSWGMNITSFYFWLVGVAVFLYDEERSGREGVYALLLPFLYAVCMNMASNQRFHVMAFAVLPGTCLSVLMLGRYAQRHALRIWNVRIPYLSMTAAVVLVVQLCACVYVRSHHFFWEYPKDNPMTSQITAGPLKGIWTKQENQENYDALLEAVMELGDVSDQQIMFYPTVPAGYLMADCKMAAPSAWMTFLHPRDPRLLRYYELNPDKTPDIVFVDRRLFMSWKEKEYESFAEEYGYQVRRYDEKFAVLQR